MVSSRIFRLIEGSLVTLFFLQGVRLIVAKLLSLTNISILTGQIAPQVVYLHLMLMATLVPVWFSPRSRQILPPLLLISTLIVAVARAVMAVSIGNVSIDLYAALIIVTGGAVYFSSALRANRTSFLSMIISGLVLDQLFRARDTFDLSLRVTVDIALNNLRYRVPWIVIQLGICVLLIVFALLARRSSRHEAYQPAYLKPLGGLALGGFFYLEMTLLAMPGVIARWSNLPYGAVVPWIVLATALPLLPSVRRLMGQTLTMFEAQSRGWIWLFIFILLILVGNRLGGVGAAGALIVAQFLAVMLFWWLPTTPDPAEMEEVGPSLSLTGLILFLLIYGYSLTFEYAVLISWLRDQALIVFLVGAALLGVARLPWREDDPWVDISQQEHRVLAPVFVFPAVFIALLLTGLPFSVTSPAPGQTLRIATYNINGGYDAQGDYQIEQITVAIETSLADVIVLQEVDAGRPVSFGVDQVEFLSRRLGMLHVFYPTVENVRGIAILSRWPITDFSGELLPSTGEQVGAIQATIEDNVTERIITVAGIQLEPGADEEVRLPQLGLLVRLIGDDAPVVLAGDMAAPPDDLVYQQLQARNFIDPDVVLGIERGFTYPANGPTQRLDYVLLRGYIPFNTLQVQSAASDHRLVVVEITWP